jgi:hypothetical protein
MCSNIVWNITKNKDSGSLKTGNIEVHVGDIIEISLEKKPREVTYVMGNANKGTFHAIFKNQGEVPRGNLEWRLVPKVEPTISTPPVTQVEELYITTPNENLIPTNNLNSKNPRITPGFQKSPWQLDNLKLVLEIVAVLLTIIGGMIALFWR